MPNPNTNFKDSFGTDLGNKLVTKEYLMSVYPQIASQLVTPELLVWGSSNFRGQLGTNTQQTSSTPVTTFLGGANWKKIATGNEHTAGIKTDGTLWVWGYNVRGQLGINTVISKSTPVTTFAGGTNWDKIWCGFYHTLAIKTDGTLWTWGSNVGGNLADNTTTDRSTPVTTFAGGTNWKQIASNAAIKTDGTLWVWGSNFYGQLGNNTGNISRSVPVTTFAGGNNWKQVAHTLGHMAAIKTDGTLWVWGSNIGGEIGINNLQNKSTPVTTFLGGNDWRVVSCGGDHTAAIKKNGTLWTWGFNYDGQCGDNTNIDKLTPVTTFAGGNNWRQVISGSSSSAAGIKTDGTLWVWGLNETNGLGINAPGNNRSTPVTTFSNRKNWVQVADMNNHGAAISISDDLQGI